VTDNNTMAKLLRVLVDQSYGGHAGFHHDGNEWHVTIALVDEIEGDCDAHWRPALRRWKLGQRSPTGRTQCDMLADGVCTGLLRSS
jgi:hypothetical protein